jgi:hypothetical protein
MNNNDIIHLKKSAFDELLHSDNCGYETHIFTCTTCHITHIDSNIDRCFECEPVTEKSLEQEKIAKELLEGKQQKLKDKQEKLKVEKDKLYDEEEKLECEQKDIQNQIYRQQKIIQNYK